MDRARRHGTQQRDFEGAPKLQWIATALQRACHRGEHISKSKAAVTLTKTEFSERRRTDGHWVAPRCPGAYQVRCQLHRHWNGHKHTVNCGSRQPPSGLACSTYPT